MYLKTNREWLTNKIKSCSSTNGQMQKSLREENGEPYRNDVRSMFCKDFLKASRPYMLSSYSFCCKRVPAVNRAIMKP